MKKLFITSLASSTRVATFSFRLLRYFDETVTTFIILLKKMTELPSPFVTQYTKIAKLRELSLRFSGKHLYFFRSSCYVTHKNYETVFMLLMLLTKTTELSLLLNATSKNNEAFITIIQE